MVRLEARKVTSAGSFTGSARGWIAGVALALASSLGLAGGVWAQSVLTQALRDGGAKPTAVVTTDQVRAELVAHAPEGVAPGKDVRLGLKIEHLPHWHTYWLNPGDSGLPTTMAWTLPSGVQAGEIEWPTPKKLPVGPLMNYGYEGTLLLPSTLRVPADWQGESLKVQLEAQWLVCKDVCIPEQGSFVLEVPTRAGSAARGALFARARESVPRDEPGVTAVGRVDDRGLTLNLSGMPAAWQGQSLDVFVETEGLVNHAAKVVGTWQGDAWSARLPLAAERLSSPARTHAVLTRPGAPRGLRVAFDVAGTWPALGATGAAGATSTASSDSPGNATAASAAGAAAVAAAGATAASATGVSGAGAVPRPSSIGDPASMTLAAALLAAFVGGLLLNLMPCVLPVLSLKVLGLSSHVGDRRQRIAHGLAYTLGVVTTFLALAGAMLALRAGGDAVGWGFQLQSPLVIAALALLFTLIGLNLAGVFEVASVLPSAVASSRAPSPTLDAWWTGVLAVAVAAPCTAPFMGAALGFAIGLPAAQALLVFAVLGLGLAAPFALVAWVPGLARWLPQPGAWMQRFKVAMAFPMFATVVWLLWVLGHQTGIDGASALLAVLVAVGFAAWAFGERSRGGSMAWPVAGALTTALALAWAWPQWRQGEAATASSGDRVSPTAAVDARWQAWSVERVAQARAQGQTVFVDFTAAWCVSCQVNKKLVLTRSDVLRAFDKHGVVTLRADWTRRDATIAAEIARLGRNGVPVYAIYAPGGAAARVLPEVLTPSIVIEALSSTH
jgi:thiol:disulfide interchange protein/DsbC/DsbD-like thiol-disulfide interchange protein